MKDLDANRVREVIELGKTALGIELGSTRIKAVLIDESAQSIAAGSYDWENQLVDGYWTYSLEDICKGLQFAYKALKEEVKHNYDVTLTTIGTIGISAMMHGYMPFDKSGELLVPFRTWRNVTTTEAATYLTEKFAYNIPERWSIAHLYQAILDNEAHVGKIDYLTTLAGYVHWQLTGQRVLGIGDASGMFPIDSATLSYDRGKIEQFQSLIDDLINLPAILPTVLNAGQQAGQLTEAGAKFLDPSGELQAGCPLCPPEGDAGTGMVATNSVAKRTGNISVGTSAFAMIVLDSPLNQVHSEIDLVTTPTGNPVAMVHANNCSSEINAWVKLFSEFAELTGMNVSIDDVYEVLFNQALQADEDSGDLVAYGFYSGEPIVKLEAGRPMFLRQPTSNFNLANFMYSHIASAFGAVRIGMDILKTEEVKVDKLVGHGGIFKTAEVGQRILAAAMEAPVTVMDTAAEGGAWGMALLAAFSQHQDEQSLDTYLSELIFKDTLGHTVEPTATDLVRYNQFIARYEEALEVERLAVEGGNN